MNTRMSALLGGRAPRAREEDVPEQFLAVVRGGWIVEGDAQLLKLLRSGYSGGGTREFEDVVQHEAAVNGRAMVDYDLPRSGTERIEMLLRRSLGYACSALAAVPEGRKWPVRGYVSLSSGGLDDEILTAYVTFCSDRPDLPRYADDLDVFAHEALLELSQDDAAGVLSV
jgi:hypothetical protein